jgi:hypothetical protein
MTDANRIQDRLGDDSKIAVTPEVLKDIFDIPEAERKNLREAFSLMFEILCIATFRRREHNGRDIHFSVNIGIKGHFILMRLKAVRSLNIEEGMMITISRPEVENQRAAIRFQMSEPLNQSGYWATA